MILRNSLIVLLILINICCCFSQSLPPKIPTPKLAWLDEYAQGQNTGNILYYYVATNGSDSNPGTISQPFQTIYKAKEVVRQEKNSWNGPITVYFREGTYYLPKTVYFTVEDSGTSAENAITYSAYPNENVTFSGGYQVNPSFSYGWSGWSNQNGANNIYGQIAKAGDSTDTIIYLGKFDSLAGCIEETKKNGSFLSYTYTNLEYRYEEWRSTCYARLDDQWKLTEEDFIISGRPYTVYQAYIPELHASNFSSSSLFINGLRQWPARFPDADYHNEKVDGTGYRNVLDGIGGSGSNPNPEYPAQPAQGLFYNEASWSLNVKDWDNVEASNVHVFPVLYWGNLIYRTKGVKDTLIYFGAGGGQINLYKFNYGGNIGLGSRFFVENLLAELDGPGEFFVNKTTGMLYLVPRGNYSFDDAEIVFPQVEQAFRFQGEMNPEDTSDPSIYVSNIVMNGFIYTQTLPTYLKPYQAPSSGDWTIHRGGTIFLQQAAQISIRNSVFLKVGGNAVFIDGACTQVDVSQNECTSPGDSCVAVVGYLYRSTGSTLLFPKQCTVSQNYMHDIGFYGKQTAGVFVSVAKQIVVSNNLIHTMPRAAILVNDGYNGGHIVEYNEAYNCVQETSDHACFNSWGRERFWPELFNHPFVGGTPPYFPAGPITWDVIIPITVRNNIFSYPVITANGVIDMDDGTSNYHVYENVCLGGAIKIGSTGDLHYVYNNIFYQVSYPVFFWLPMVNNNDTFVRNILVYTNDSVNPNQVIDMQDQSQMRGIMNLDRKVPSVIPNMINHGKSFNEVASVVLKNDDLVIIYQVSGALYPAHVDYNLLYQLDNDDNFAIAYNDVTESIDDWQKLGRDQNSIFGKNPDFENPITYNFTLKPSSPALGLGFVNFAYGPQMPVGPDPAYAGSAATTPKHLSNQDEIVDQSYPF